MKTTINSGAAFDPLVKILEPQIAYTGELGLDYQQGPVRGRTSIY